MKPLSECNETELKRLMVAALMPDFHIATEVTGKHLIEQKNIRADYIIRPKPHLVKREFDDVYIAVEVKATNGTDIFRASSTMWQCATYVQCQYWGKVRPLFGIVFPGLSTFSGGASSLSSDTQVVATAKAARILAHIGQFMNVGFLETRPDNLADWSITIGGQRYFSQKYGKSNMNLVKRYIGNKEAA